MAASRPVVSRRREVGGGSARSLLTTVLGEFVLPGAEPVWTADARRRARVLRRRGEGGPPGAGPDRRRGPGCAPTASAAGCAGASPARAARLLAEGAERIYGFGSGERRWDGRWLVLLVSVPETRRDLRHQLRTRLSWAGFGSPDGRRVDHPARGRGGRREADPGRAGPVRPGHVVPGELRRARPGARHGGAARGTSRRWPSATTRSSPSSPPCPPDTPDGVLRAQTRLVHAWRRFPFLDPQLPAELLPAKWSGTTATTCSTTSTLAGAPGTATLGRAGHRVAPSHAEMHRVALSGNTVQPDFVQRQALPLACPGPAALDRAATQQPRRSPKPRTSPVSTGRSLVHLRPLRLRQRLYSVRRFHRRWRSPLRSRLARQGEPTWLRDGLSGRAAGIPRTPRGPRRRWLGAGGRTPTGAGGRARARSWRPHPAGREDRRAGGGSPAGRRSPVSPRCSGCRSPITRCRRAGDARPRRSRRRPPGGST